MANNTRSFDEVICICKDISCIALGTIFSIRVERDNKDKVNGRIFIQITYNARCSNTGILLEWHGRKWYLSDHMTEDEIVKTCYVAFEAAVKHEVMEGFKINGITVFNPHVNYLELMKISDKEITRN